MSDKEKLRFARSRAELWRTYATFAQLIIAIITLAILVLVHFL